MDKWQLFWAARYISKVFQLLAILCPIILINGGSKIPQWAGPLLWYGGGICMTLALIALGVQLTLSPSVFPKKNKAG